jgi:large subunit ribosomal protein L16
MSLMPKRVKYRKSQRGRIRGNATSGNYIAFGDYGIQAMEPGWLTAQQLEACRVVLSRSLGNEGRYWCRVFPHKSVTAIAAETRMGKGKGEIEYWAVVIKPGTVLFEVAGIPETAAREAFRLQSGKLPFRMKFLTRRAEF